MNSISKNLIPLCKNCIYYKSSIYDLNNNNNLGICRKFARRNKYNRKIEFDYASLVRDENNKCGYIGKYFQSKLNKINTP